MSTLPQQSTIQQYLADGATTAFSYNFMILLSSDLNVYVTLPGNTPNPEVDLVSSADYSVSNVGNVNGGIVTFTVAPVANAIVTFVRNMQLTIGTNFAAAQTFNGANLDAAFERVLLIIQQMQGIITDNGTLQNAATPNGAISRCLQYQIDDYFPGSNPTLMPSLFTLNGQATDGLVWISQGSAITVTPLFTGGDANALKTLLASETPMADGASLIGYYDNASATPTTVNAWLQALPSFVPTTMAPYLQNGYAVSATDTGAVNALVITLSPALTAYAAYNRFYVKVANTNSGATTINVNGLGAKAVTYMDTVALSAGALQVGSIYELVYDGTRFQLLNPFIKPATNSQALAGTDSIHPLTSAAVASGLSTIGTSASGYVTLPGGLIMQWAKVTVAGTGGFNITLPIAFPNQILTIQVSAVNALNTVAFTVGSYNNGTHIISGSGTTAGGPIDYYGFAVGN